MATDVIYACITGSTRARTQFIISLATIQEIRVRSNYLLCRPPLNTERCFSQLNLHTIFNLHHSPTSSDKIKQFQKVILSRGIARQGHECRYITTAEW